MYIGSGQLTSLKMPVLSLDILPDDTLWKLHIMHQFLESLFDVRSTLPFSLQELLHTCSEEFRMEVEHDLRERST